MLADYLRIFPCPALRLIAEHSQCRIATRVFSRGPVCAKGGGLPRQERSANTVGELADYPLFASSQGFRFHDLLELSHDLGMVLGKITDYPSVIHELLQVAHDQDEVEDVPAM